MATGHTVVVADARYFANFGHFHYKGQDVMMPFFVNSQIAIPGTKRIFGLSRSLLVPVSHAEYEWQIRGPKVNADVSWYFGIDGKAEFRTMDTLDQAWVLGRHAHEYRDAHAVEVTRLVGKMLIAYAAWQDGSLERTRSWMAGMTLRVVGAAAWVVLFGVVVWRRRRARK